MNTIIEKVIQILLSKSQHCQHGCCCLEYIFNSGLQTFKLAYLIKIGLSLIQSILKIQKNGFIPILQAFISKPNLNFCLFLTTYTLITKGFHCLLRNLMDKEDQKYAFYSGLVAGIFSMLILNQQQRKIWALYAIYAYMIIFAFMQLIAAYAYFFEADCFGEKYTKVWEQFQNLSLREQHYRALSNLSIQAK